MARRTCRRTVPENGRCRDWPPHARNGCGRTSFRLLQDPITAPPILGHRRSAQEARLNTLKYVEVATLIEPLRKPKPQKQINEDHGSKPFVSVLGHSRLCGSTPESLALGSMPLRRAPAGAAARCGHMSATSCWLTLTEVVPWPCRRLLLVFQHQRMHSTEQVRMDLSTEKDARENRFETLDH